ncbi:MAG: AmmeMemoRadiSam system protein B [Desulfobacteraceae bacterium]|nr:AmmeMemoRadiSam system protein B [Desulfobacteraceae bacterium]
MERKRAAFKGSWYPAEARGCERDIAGFLSQGKGDLQGEYVGGIVPHAGWYYSGSIACRVIGTMAAGAGAGEVDVVLLFGLHMSPGSTPRVMVRGGWETPFGDLAVHEAFAVSLAKRVGANSVSPATFPDDNTIEVQLPFVKHFFPTAAIVPVGVPPSKVARIMGTAAADVASELGLATKVIGSTDMTHYGLNYGFTPEGTGETAYDWVRKTNDPKAIKAMVSMDADAIVAQGLNNHNLCCAGAAAAAATASKALGAVRGIELDYATSYEKSPGDSFVGYSGILFEKA